jgi:hypothetical protein
VTRPPDRPPVVPPPARDPRAAVPEAAAVAAARKQIKEALKEEYAATTPTDRVKLGLALARHSDRVPGQPAQQYAALRESQDAFARAAQVTWTLRAAGELCRRFEVDVLETKCAGLELLARSDPQRPAPRQLAIAALTLAAQAVDADNYALAGRLLSVGRDAAKGANDAALTRQAGRLAPRLELVKKEHAKVEAALKALAGKPEDAAASAAVGKFLCCCKDDWEQGLPLLQRGNDQALAEQARKDLTGAADAADRKALGDGWWALAQKAKDPVKTGWQRRAHHWYRLAVADLKGAARADVERRVKALVTQIPALADPWPDLVFDEATLLEGYFRPRLGRAVTTRRAYSAPVEITAVVRLAKGSVRLLAWNGAEVRLGFRDAAGELRVARPDGRVVGVGSQAIAKPWTVEAGRWYQLRWRVTPTGMKVWVDDELAFEEDRPYDLSVKEAPALQSLGSGLEVKSFTVKRLP